MQVGDFVKFSKTNGHPTASAVGTSDIGEIVGISTHDGEEYANVIFPDYDGEVQGIPTSMLIAGDSVDQPLSWWGKIKALIGL